MQAPRFGYCVPIFANPGPAFFRTPALTALDPVAAVEAAVEAERLGFDSVWVADHLMHGYDGGIMEGWTTLSVIAGKTSRVQLGTIHLAQPFREPAIAAKMAATLDAISGGRLIFFYDCGWQEPEVRAYGLEWPDEEERIARMDEGLTADRRALAGRRAAELRRALLRDRRRDLPPEAGPAPAPARLARRVPEPASGTTRSAATPTAGTARRPARPASRRSWRASPRRASGSGAT